MAYRAKASYYRGKLILPFNAGSGRAEDESDDLLLRPTFPTSPTYWFGWDTTLRFSQAAIQCPAPILFLAQRCLRLDAHRAADYVTELRQGGYISAVTLGQLASDSLCLQPFFQCRKSIEGSFYLKQRASFLRHFRALGSNMRLLRISPVLV